MNNSKLNQNAWCAPIDKLMLWRNSWTKCDRNISNLYLRVHYDQLLITSDTKIIESFNMHHKLKGIYKGDVMILIVSDSNLGIRKLKFQIKTNTANCLETLGCHFPVVNHNELQPNDVMKSKYRNINDVLKCAVEQNGNDMVSSQPVKMPTEFENFVKLCFLDPTFPEFVSETEKILHKITVKK